MEDEVVQVPALFVGNETFGDCWRYLIGWEKCTGYFVKMQQAILDGEETFPMLKPDYKEALEYVERNKHTK